MNGQLEHSQQALLYFNLRFFWGSRCHTWQCLGTTPSSGLRSCSCHASGTVKGTKLESLIYKATAFPTVLSLQHPQFSLYGSIFFGLVTQCDSAEFKPSPAFQVPCPLSWVCLCKYVFPLHHSLLAYPSGMSLTQVLGGEFGITSAVSRIEPQFHICKTW